MREPTAAELEAVSVICWPAIQESRLQGQLRCPGDGKAVFLKVL